MGTFTAILNVLSGGIDVVKGWLGMQKTATDQKAGADAAVAKQQGDALKEVGNAKAAEDDVSAASDADRDELRDKWTR